MEIYAPSAAQRRLLVELLACELDGEPWVGVRAPLRQLTARELASRRLVLWFDPARISLTHEGRSLAEGIAAMMIGSRQAAYC